MIRHATLATLLAGLLATGPAALAATGAADRVSVVDPYVRLAPPGAQATAAFMVLKNEADKDTALVKVDNPASRITELHTHINDGGVMKMRPVKSIEIKAKGEAALKPGGFHVMMIELKAGMKDGDTVPLTLQFADGSSKKVDAKVRKPGAEPAPAMDHSQHKH
ncbi:MAG: copper chaperone PCu(A)C [Rhodocyclaceae bacterium]|nr:copper chaperone PCu(A)C [Rhodocyclaceae bacterium]